MEDRTLEHVYIAALNAAVHGFEERVRVPHGTLTNLLKGDDWSLVIKSHALLESSVTLLLAHSLDQRLQPVLSRLELGKSETGKLEFAKALGLLTPEERRFIKYMSALRNLLAHDPSFIGFTFDQHIRNMDKNQQRAFFDTLTATSFPEHKQRDIAFAKAQPAHALVTGVMGVMLAINAKTVGNEPAHQARVLQLSQEYLAILQEPGPPKS